jgi:hypothetical protein
MPLVAGREFSVSDGPGAPRVAIVNEAFTRKFGLDGRDAVGHFMGSGRGEDLDTRIVGVVQDAGYSDVKQETPPVFFRPYRQDDEVGSINFYVRTSLQANQILTAIPPLMGELDPNLPVQELKTLERQVQENVMLDRLISTLSSAFAILATLLATVGLYGVLAYTVTQRTREIGVRMALGAGSGRVKGMVLRQVTRMTLIGGTVGIIAASFLGRAAESLLFGIEGSDPLVLVTVALLLVGGSIGSRLPSGPPSIQDRSDGGAPIPIRTHRSSGSGKAAAGGSRSVRLREHHEEFLFEEVELLGHLVPGGGHPFGHLR